MIKTVISRFLLGLSGVLFLGSFGAVEAGLVFVNESDGTHDPVFYIDSGDASTDFIDLEFGTTLDAKLRYDIVNDLFSINRDTDFGNNQLQNVRIANLATPPICDGTVVGKVYFNTTDNNSYICNGTAFEQLNNGAIGADSLDFDDFADALIVDATTTFDLDTNGVDLNFDSNTFVIDSSTNRVGIGTDSPSTKLQVVGQARASSFSVAGNGASAPAYRFETDANTGIFSAAADTLSFSTGGTEQLQITPDGDLDLLGHEIQDVKLESLAAAPVICDATHIGRIYYDTTELASFVCNGSAWEILENNAGPYTADLKAALYSNDLGTNVNAAATDNLVPWNLESFEDDIFLHDNALNNSRIPVTETGRYLVSGAISLNNTSTTNFRYNGRVKFRVNGTTVLDPRFQPGYIRRAGGQDETSLVFSLIMELSANDYFEVLVDRENTVNGAATMIANQSSLSIVHLKVPVEESVTAPFVTSSAFDLKPNLSQTKIIEGTGFLPTSTVSIPGFTGTIDGFTVLSPTEISLDLTTPNTTAAFDLVVTNGDLDNTFWPGNGVGLINVEIVTGTGVAGTLTESFETDFGSWVDGGGDVAWARNSGGTMSGGTGPVNASDGAFYVYTEASAPNFPSNTFILQTTDFAVAQSLSFDYHMFGGSIGTLEVQVLRNGDWKTLFLLEGQQQVNQADPYISETVDLSVEQVEAVRFMYTSGANFDGDCAIDNISLIST